MSSRSLRLRQEKHTFKNSLMYRAQRSESKELVKKKKGEFKRIYNIKSRIMEM